MGSSRTSAARASSTLWRAILTWKDVSCARNCSTSTSKVSLNPVHVVVGNPHSARHAVVDQLRTVAAIQVTVGEERALSKHSRSSKNLRKASEPYCSSASPGIKTLMDERQSVRNISLQVSKEVPHDEDIKSGDGDSKGEDDVFLPAHDGESANAISPESTADMKSEMEVLFRRLERCIRTGKTVPQIERYISDGHNFTKDGAVILISKLRRYNRYFQAAEILDWIAEKKMLPWTAYDQAVLLSVKGKLGLSSAVEKIFNDSPPELQTEIAYNAVIKHFCEKGMITKANEWIERLVNSGLMTHAFAFNRLLGLYKDKRMKEKVNEVLEAMNAAGISKDVYTYNILMAIKGKRKDISGVEKIFDDCKADPKVKVDPSTYATLAVAYIDAGFTEKAIAALEEGERLDFERTGNADEVIATLWGKLGNKEKVLRMWGTMKENETIAARTYVVMMETFGRLGMVDQAEMLFHDMEQTKGKVRPRQFTALLSAYANNNMVDKAEALVARIDAMDLNRNSLLNHHIVLSYVKMDRLDKALAVLSEPKWKGKFPLWFQTMVVLLNAAAEKGDVSTAEKMFDNLMTVYNQKNQTVYNTLLKAYAKAGLPADGFLQRMAGGGVSPNKQTYELLQLCSVKDALVHGSCSENVPSTVAPPAS